MIIHRYSTIGLCLIIAFALVLTGCAQSPTVMNYGAVSETYRWPQEPEIPRYRFVGELTGEQNFKQEKASLGSKILGWLVGLTSRKHRPTILKRPQNGYVDEQGRIYITDVSRGAVYVFDEPQGKLSVWENADNNIPFDTPIGITTDSKGRILVADAELGLVSRLDSTGNPIDVIGKGDLVRPTGLAVDRQRNRIYVSDTQAHMIKIFNDAGNLMDSFGGHGEAKGLFNAPTYLTFVDDQLYVTDTLNSRIQVFTATGDFIKSIGKRGLYVGDLPRPKGVAVDNDNNIYVVESYYDHLLVFNDEGEFLMPIGGTGSGIGEFYLPAGVWTDDRNRVYVADAFNGRVVIFQYLGQV